MNMGVKRPPLTDANRRNLSAAMSKPRGKRRCHRHNVDDEAPMIYATGFYGRICSLCGELKEVAEFYKAVGSHVGLRATCKQCISSELIAKKYGLSAEAHAALLLKQDHKCAICRRDGHLHVDHSHSTDTVRGLLCGSCNRGIGLLGEDEARFRAAADYLKNN